MCQHTKEQGKQRVVTRGNVKMAEGDKTMNLGLRLLTDEEEDNGWLRLVARASQRIEVVTQ